MADLLKSVSFTDPYAAEEAAIRRQEAMAKLLYDQEYQPMPAGQMVSGWYVPTSPLHGLASALQKGFQAKYLKDAEKKREALLTKQEADRASDLSVFLGALSPQQPNPQVAAVSRETTPTESDAGPQPMLPPPQPMTPQNRMVEMLRSGQLRTPQMQQVALSYALQNAGGGRDMLGKVDIDKFDPASVNKFLETGNYADLKPRVKHEAVQGVGPGGTPITQFVDPYAPPPQGVAHPAPGFVGQLQAMGLLQPGMERDPRVQQIIAGYIGKETGQITPEAAVRLGIELGRLNLTGQQANWDTGGAIRGAGQVPIQPFNPFGPAPAGMPPRGQPVVPPSAGAPAMPGPGGGQPLVPGAPQPQAAPQGLPLAVPQSGGSVGMPAAVPGKAQMAFSDTLARESGQQYAKLVEDSSKLGDQADLMDRSLEQFMRYRQNSLAGTGPFATAFGLTKYLNEDLQSLEATFRTVNLKNMVATFSGFSRAIDTEAERRAWEATQPGIALDDKANVSILVGGQALTAKAQAEGLARRQYMNSNRSLQGYESPVIGKTTVLFTQEGKPQLVPKEQVQEARKQGLRTQEERITQITGSLKGPQNPVMPKSWTDQDERRHQELLRKKNAAQ